ncbi:hypothetical protein PtA15_13A329 [Puccinia triticina]|uniref:UBX domain-containing protein n=1 Tax=Puccinia triticina TaxID=208348 RepID=A0ABY7D028_9BASI|nr:uncharacterized protein PtA15_13A329 [Puccinia triticina]WAQ90929.1 hypothetical protein PtA15_13A329 [Puccinia triticina]
MNPDTLDDEAISSYLSFTNTSDVQAARHALQLANGNLEAAVEAYLDSHSHPTSALLSNDQERSIYEQLSLDDSSQSDRNLASANGPPNGSATASNQPASAGRSRPSRAFESAPRPRRSSSKLLSFFFRLWIGPFRLIAIPVSFVADLGLTVFSLLGRLLGLRLPTISFHWPRPSSFGWTSGPMPRTDPRTAAERWVRELEEELQARSSYTTAQPGDPAIPRLPEFLLLGYDDAVQKAREELKVLMVVLVSEEHDDVYQFKRGTLMDEELLNLLRTKDILVWGGDVKERDASFAAHVLDVTTYPFVAFVSLQAKRPSSTVTTITSSVNRSSSNVMSVCTRLEGSPMHSTSSRSLCTTINNVVIPRTNGYLSRLRAEKARWEADRRLREQQDRAYAEAGRLDRERVMRKKAEMEAERKRVEELQQRQLAREKARQERLEEAEQKRRWRYWARREKMPSEPPSTGGGVTIGFRLGDGRRVVRKFAPDAPLEALYLFVELESASAAIQEEDSSAPLARPSPDYRHSYSFKLSTAMPRRILPLPDPSPDNCSDHHQISIAKFGGLDGANVNVEGNLVRNQHLKRLGTRVPFGMTPARRAVSQAMCK